MRSIFSPILLDGNIPACLSFNQENIILINHGVKMNTTLLNSLAEPNRLRIVELLKDGPLTVGEIADRLQIRQPLASKHLSVLYKSGVVEFYAEANRRIYKLRSEPFKALNIWLEQYREIWEEKLDSLELYLKELQNKKQ